MLIERGVGLAALFWLATAPVLLAQTTESTTEAAPEPVPRHRIDFGADWFDAAEGAIMTGYLNYSWVPLPSHALAATLQLVGSDLSESEGSGIGDLRLQYSFVPSAKLTASPWLPNSLGMGFGLIAPVGDENDGTGGGRWIAIPNIGWVVDIKGRFFLLPTLQFFESIGESDGIDPIRLVNLEFGMLYVTKSEFWFNYTPSLFRDLEPEEDTNLDHSFTVGKQITRTFGISLLVGTLERGDVQNPEFQRSTDGHAALTLHFVLPW